MKKTNTILSVLISIVAVLMVIGVSTVFSACGPKDDGSYMHCHMVQLIAACLGICIACFSIISFFTKNKTFVLILRVVSMIMAVITIILPFAMKMCMMNTMQCHSVMKPFLLVAGIIMIILSAISLVTISKDR